MNIQSAVQNVSTAKKFDKKLVDDYLVAQELSDVAIAPTMTYRVGQKMLQVDQYSWGKVCYANNVGSEHVTWVEHDNIPVLPMWVRELRARLRPHCLGFHESDPTCDGDGKEPVCAWRERCLYTKEAALHNELDALEAAVGLTNEQLLQGATSRIQQDVSPRIRDYDGEPYPALKRQPIHTTQTGVSLPVASGKVIKKKRTDSGDQLVASRELAMRFIKMVGMRGGWTLCDNKYTAVKHNLLITDRSESSSYINLYMKTDHAVNSRKIICVVWILKTSNITVQIHTEASAKIIAALPGFDTGVWSDCGKPCVSVKSVKEEHLGLVSRVLAEAIRDGDINNVSL